MTLSILLIIGGLALLLIGGELLVRGAVAIAQLAGLTPSVVGLTVVAAGTSMPELVVSVDAALAGNAGLSFGNVIGSNIFNIAAIVGIAALMAPLRIQGNIVRFEWPIMLLASCQLYLLARDGVVDRLEGGFLGLGLVLFVAFAVKVARTAMDPDEAEQFAAAIEDSPVGSGFGAWMPSILGVVAGCGVLAGGAHILVVGAVDLASAAGVSATVIGLTIVAVGTSLPELATSTVASFRGRDDIAIANVIGSNVFNMLGIVGVTAVIQPLSVPAELLSRDILWMIGFSVLLFPLMRSGLRVSRLEGMVLLAGYVAYLVVLLSD